MDLSRQTHIRRVIVIEGFINLSLLGVKFSVGLATNSLVVLADAVHSLTDLANNLIAWAILKIADRPPDENHPYGHRKFEVLAVFVLATLLSVLAIELAVSAFSRSEDENIMSTTWMLGLMLGVLVVNLITAMWQRKKSTELGSRIIAADATHTFADVLTTIGVIVGWQLAVNGYPVLDSVATLLVAGLIIYMSFGLFRSTLPILLDEVAVPSDEVRSLTAQIEGVKSVRRVRSRWIGETISLDMIITVDPSMTTSDAHDIADQIEHAMDSKFADADTTVHIEPH